MGQTLSVNFELKFYVVSLCINRVRYFSRAGGAGMTHYRAYLLGQKRRAISMAKLQCADEQETRDRAQQLVDANDIELWQLDRRIAVFEAPTSRTSQAAAEESVQRAQPPRTNLSKGCDPNRRPTRLSARMAAPLVVMLSPASDPMQYSFARQALEHARSIRRHG